MAFALVTPVLSIAETARLVLAALMLMEWMQRWPGCSSERTSPRVMARSSPSTKPHAITYFWPRTDSSTKRPSISCVEAQASSAAAPRRSASTSAARRSASGRKYEYTLRVVAALR